VSQTRKYLVCAFYRKTVQATYRKFKNDSMWHYALIPALVLALLLGCAVARPGMGSSVIPDYDFESLVKDLRAAGEIVEVTDRVRDSDLFSEERRARITLGEAIITVLEYDDVNDAEAEASRISPDGHNIHGTTLIVFKEFTHVDWIDTPHFFKKGKLIVQYVGNEESVLKALEGVLVVCHS
jgi:hypothetical protein